MSQITNKEAFCFNKSIINMDSNDELKEIDIKHCTSYYFYDIIEIEDFDINDIFIDQKPYENVLFYNISYKSLTNSKLFCTRLNKIDGLIKVYDGTSYFVLLGSGKYGYIYSKIRYLISVKSGITDIAKVD